MNELKYFKIRIDMHFVIKVSDFGLSESVKNKEYFREQSDSFCIPMKWMSPESLQDRLYTEKTDVVSSI